MNRETTEVQSLFNQVEYDNFIGFGKGAGQKRNARVEKKSAKTDIRKAKAERIRNDGESKIILANQGIVKPSPMDSISNTISGLIGKVTGRTNSEGQPQDSITEGIGVQRKQSNNTILYIGIGLVVAGAIVYVVLRKK